MMQNDIFVLFQLGQLAIALQLPLFRFCFLFCLRITVSFLSGRSSDQIALQLPVLGTFLSWNYNIVSVNKWVKCPLLCNCQRLGPFSLIITISFMSNISSVHCFAITSAWQLFVLELQYFSSQVSQVITALQLPLLGNVLSLIELKYLFCQVDQVSLL